MFLGWFFFPSFNLSPVCRNVIRLNFVRWRQWYRNAWVNGVMKTCVCVCVCLLQNSEVVEQVLHTISKSSSLEELTLENAGLKAWDTLTLSLSLSRTCLSLCISLQYILCVWIFLTAATGFLWGVFLLIFFFFVHFCLVFARRDFPQKMAVALAENPASVLHSLNLAHNAFDNQGVMTCGCHSAVYQ